MAVQTCFISSRLPKLNEMLAAARAHKGKWQRYDEMKACYGSICKVDMKKAKLRAVTGPVSLHFLWMEPDMRHNPDNIMAGQKFAIDALVATGILKNDGWRQITSITHAWIVVRQRPGVQLVIHEDTKGAR